MKIFYDHIYGNTTKYDIIYGLALAEVEKEEEDQANSPATTDFLNLVNCV